MRWSEAVGADAVGRCPLEPFENRQAAKCGLHVLGVRNMDLADPRVMVTGGKRFLGRRVTLELEKRGATPIVIRSADYDLTDPRRVRAALEDPPAEWTRPRIALPRLMGRQLVGEIPGRQ